MHMRRHGYTFRDLLLVFGVLGLALALLAPAFNRMRSDGSRDFCIYHMKSLAFGLTYFEETAQTFPPYRGTFKLRDDSYLEVPWPVYIFEHVEYATLAPP